MEKRLRSIWDESYDHEAQGKLLAELKLQVHYDKIAKLILVALANQKDGLTKAELLMIARSRKQRFLATLKRLLELERVFRSKGGKRGRPFRYRLTRWN